MVSSWDYSMLHQDWKCRFEALLERDLMERRLNTIILHNKSHILSMQIYKINYLEGTRERDLHRYHLYTEESCHTRYKWLYILRCDTQIDIDCIDDLYMKGKHGICGKFSLLSISVLREHFSNVLSFGKKFQK